MSERDDDREYRQRKARSMAQAIKRKDTSRLPVEKQLQAETNQGGEYSKKEYKLSDDAFAAQDEYDSMLSRPGRTRSDSVAVAQKLRSAVARLRAERDKTNPSKR